MKITRSRLKQIIKEELERLNENEPPFEDPAVNELLDILGYIIQDAGDALADKGKTKADKVNVMKAIEWLLEDYWANPPEDYGGDSLAMQAALQEAAAPTGPGTQ